jgi:CDGSH iron-sulfur domain-containing protein 3
MSESTNPFVPVRASNTPIAVEVEAGKTYYWCSCGKSDSQPFCNGAHKGTGLAPKAFTATETKTVYFCGCKATQNGVLCDGSHNK